LHSGPIRIRGELSLDAFQIHVKLAFALVFAGFATPAAKPLLRTMIKDFYAEIRKQPEFAIL
jgi:hypothetical protein